MLRGSKHISGSALRPRHVREKPKCAASKHEGLVKMDPGVAYLKRPRILTSHDQNHKQNKNTESSEVKVPPERGQKPLIRQARIRAARV